MVDHYTVMLNWEPVDQCFVASVAELPGCMADGRTRRDAVKAIGVLIPEWIAVHEDLGNPVPPAAEHVPSLTLQQVSVFAGLSTARLRHHIAQGELRAVRIAREWRVSPLAFADFERARAAGASEERTTVRTDRPAASFRTGQGARPSAASRARLAKRRAAGRGSSRSQSTGSSR